MTEIPEVRVWWLERWVMLYLNVGQHVQVWWRYGCTHYLPTQHWLSFGVLAEGG